MTRDEMIDALTEEAVDYIRSAMERGDTALLAHYLTYGFIGYENMSESELLMEYECTIEDNEEDEA